MTGSRKNASSTRKAIDKALDGEGHALTDMLEAYRRAVETEDLEGRITDLERRMEKR